MPSSTESRYWIPSVSTATVPRRAMRSKTRRSTLNACWPKAFLNRQSMPTTSTTHLSGISPGSARSSGPPILPSWRLARFCGRAGTSLPPRKWPGAATLSSVSSRCWPIFGLGLTKGFSIPIRNAMPLEKVPAVRAPMCWPCGLDYFQPLETRSWWRRSWPTSKRAMDTRRPGRG